MITAMQMMLNDLISKREVYENASMHHSVATLETSIELAEYLLEKEKEQIGYTEEQAYEIWKAGQEYWKTSGKSITFEDLIENFKPKSILQPNI
jgi:tRNA U34 5-carboxymethylaminomethyl modifying enzyme MnmG/GidA